MNLQAYSLFLPNLILFIALSLYPISWAIRFVFFRYGGRPTEIPIFVGLENFIRVFKDTYYWHSVSNTFVYAGLKLVLTIPVAFFLAVILNKKTRGNQIFQSIIFMPTVTSSAIMGLIFFLLFNAYNGEISRYLMAFHIIDTPVNWLGRDHAMMTVVIVAAWGAIGNYMVYFLAGLQMISKEIEESAIMDGVNRRQLLFFIDIPMLGPILKIILMLALAAAFGDMTTIMVMTEGGPVNATMVMSLYAYQLFFPISVGTGVLQPQYGYGAAVSFVSAVIAGVCTVIYLWLSRKLDEIY
jgi:ABC-type sugar transport system permease subunit